MINRTDTNVLRKQPIARRLCLIPKHSFVVHETHTLLTDRLQEHIDIEHSATRELQKYHLLLVGSLN